MTLKNKHLLFVIPAVLLSAVNATAAPIQTCSNSDLEPALVASGTFEVSQSAGKFLNASLAVATDNNNNNNNNNNSGGSGGGKVFKNL